MTVYENEIIITFHQTSEQRCTSFFVYTNTTVICILQQMNLFLELHSSDYCSKIIVCPKFIVHFTVITVTLNRFRFISTGLQATFTSFFVDIEVNFSCTQSYSRSWIGWARGLIPNYSAHVSRSPSLLSHSHFCQCQGIPRWVRHATSRLSNISPSHYPYRKVRKVDAAVMRE